MIERQLRHLRDEEPLGVRRVRGSFGAVVGEFDQGVMGDAHDSFPRVAAKFAKSVKLLQENVLESCFLSQFTARRVVNGFIHAHETAGQCPFPFERFECALDQQHFEFAFVEAEDHAVHGQCRSGILVCVWHIIGVVQFQLGSSPTLRAILGSLTG